MSFAQSICVVAIQLWLVHRSASKIINQR
jgi:hypothetical protein